MAVPLFSRWSAAISQSSGPKTVAELPGTSLKWTKAAEVEIHQKKLDLDNSILSVVDQDDLVTVILKSADAPEGSKGSGGSHVGYEIEIRKRDSKIMRSSYLR